MKTISNLQKFVSHRSKVKVLRLSKQFPTLIVVFRFRTRIILQLSPLQSPHAATHVKPFFLYDYKFVPQVFREVLLQLQRTKFNNSFGAGSRSVIVGAKEVLVYFSSPF